MPNESLTWWMAVLPRASKIRYFGSLIDEAFAGLCDNGLRSVLSIGGVSVGIAGIIMVSAISTGGKDLVFQELRTFGLESIWVYRQRNDKDPKRTTRGGSGIDEMDYEVIRNGCCDKLKAISPLVYQDGPRPVIRRGNRYSNADVEGVGYQFFSVNNEELAEGRWFSLREEQRRARVAIIGPTARRDLFIPHEEVAGREVRIDGKKFVVLGVLKEKSRDFLASIGSSGGQDANNRILVPYTYMQRANGRESAGEIDVLQGNAVSLEGASSAAAQVKAVLKRNHHRRYSYAHETMAQYIEATERILKGVSTIGLVAASLSLFVGGMGVMNIMSTAALERTREIGLRRAMGARKKDIFYQFVVEAMIIGLTGGAIGTVGGIAGSYALAWGSEVIFQLRWEVVGVALVASMVVGVLSGLAPAMRASNGNPVEALRYE